MSYTTENDIELVMKWKQGDQMAAEQLIKRYMPLIGSLLHKAYGSEDEEDLRQTLILQFLTKAKEYEPAKDAKFSGYIAKGLQWVLWDECKKAQYRRDHEELTLDDQAEQGAEDDYSSETIDLLLEAAKTAHLTKKQTKVFLLSMEGKGFEEIVTELGMQRTSLKRMKLNIQKRFQLRSEELKRLVSD